MMPNRSNGSSTECANFGATALVTRLMHGDHPHEAHYLKLDCSKARMRLGWRPCWDLQQALTSILEWVKDIFLRQ